MSLAMDLHGTRSTTASAADALLALQRRQLRHDRAYHPDVWCLEAPKRMAHYCIHFAKYAGQLLEGNAAVRGTALADIAVLALAAANTIKLDLRTVPAFSGVDEAQSFEAFARTHGKDRPDLPLHEAYLPLLARYARATDKACHLERFDALGTYEAVLPEMLLLAATPLSETGGIAEALDVRLREIESRSPLHSD